MSRKSKRILLTLASAAVGAACGAAVYFIRKGKADLETDFDDFKAVSYTHLTLPTIA